MPGLLPTVDPDGLLEYSVVYTDRSLNHMSGSFVGVMNAISTTLRKVYSADAVVVVPGSGTFAMEAVARQFATGRKCMVIRNGWFSFRWSQIFDMGSIPSESIVMKARPAEAGRQAAFAPQPIGEVKERILAERPEMVFAPHVETSAGIVLPDDYINALAEAVHSVGGILVLDCIASGAIWVDMDSLGVDVLISAPQKGWTGSPCCGLVMLNARALEQLDNTTSTSFACDLRKWRDIMAAYEGGGHAYHATMPTDGLKTFAEIMAETERRGFDEVRSRQETLGTRVRDLLEGRGFKSLAAEGFRAAGVVVSYTDDPMIKSGRKFADAGVQVAAGVPLQCDEPLDFSTFRIGLFGLDKLDNIDRTVSSLEEALDRLE